ncbi:hypothetical protein WAK64_19875 [Bacillus spongiae]|uniref:Uncharacterized protein n=1 Tax=Bacillus spongiae TaxID=2683610 RepID=A0ABU8HJH9_9BACI
MGIMGIIIFLILLLCLGLFFLWMAIFGKNKDIEDIGPDIPADYFDLFLILIYKLSPSIIRRILLFLLGLSIEIIAIYALFQVLS